MVIQILTLIRTYVTNADEDFDISAQVVTILSLMFTLVSIGLSIAEFCLTRHLLQSDNYVIISFEAESDHLRLKKKIFQEKIVFRTRKFVSKFAEIFKVEKSKIERLKPIKTQYGAIFVLFVDATMANVENVLDSDVAIAESKIAQVKS